MLTDGQKRTKERRENTNFESNLAMMVIYLPIKFEFDWTKCFRVRVQKQKCGQTDKQTKNGQTNGQNYTNFESNLAMILIYLPVQFEFDWTKHFRVRVQKQKCWRTNRQKTDKQTDGITPISGRNLAMMVIYLPVKFEVDRTKRFRVKVRKKNFDRWMDRPRTHQSNRQVGYTQPT